MNFILPWQVYKGQLKGARGTISSRELAMFHSDVTGAPVLVLSSLFRHMRRHDEGETAGRRASVA